MKLSLVIPLMNEEDCVAPLLKAVSTALAGIDHEVILVDDGSSDQTVQRIRQLASPNVRCISFMRNFGQSLAMAAGIDAAKGELIAVMDGDLQNDPADIPIMMQKMQETGADVIAGRRAQRKDGWILRKIPSKIANWLIRKLTKVTLNDYGCSLRLFRAPVAKNLGLYGELHRFIPVLVSMYGAKTVEVDVRHHAREFGTSKYGILRTFKVVSDLMLMVFFQRYRLKPMHLFGFLGSACLAVGLSCLLYLFGLKATGESIGQRPLLTLATMSTLAGIQLITTGFVAELVMRTYYEASQKKAYVIRESFYGHSKHKQVEEVAQV